MDGPSPFAASDRGIASGRRETAVAASCATGNAPRSQDCPHRLQISCLKPISIPVVQTFLSTLRRFLRAKQRSTDQHVSDEISRVCQNTVTISAETLLVALEITSTPDHFIASNFCASQMKRYFVIN